jgi:hypothetical protein
MGGGLLDRGSHVSDVCCHAMLKLQQSLGYRQYNRICGCIAGFISHYTEYDPSPFATCPK